MAEYTVRVNAIDSYMENIDTGQITRGAVLTASDKGSYKYTGAPMGSTCIRACAVFPGTTPAGYEKKRLKGDTLYFYITGKQGSASGQLPPGVTFGYGISQRWVGFQPGGVEGSFVGVPQNAYYPRSDGNPAITPIQGLFVYAGTSDLCYTSVTYSYNVSASMQSHTGANPPYMVYTFEDVTPSVTGARPTSGFVNEKDAVELAWDMAYNATGIQQQLTVQNSKFRYRNAGDSGYTELDYLRDKASLWNGSPTRLVIPANSGWLPLSGSWEWQVLVQSSDGIWSAPAPWYTLTTVDSTCYAEANRPKDAYVDGSEDVQLVWFRTISTGTYPSGSDYQVSTDNGITWADIGHAEGYSDLIATPGKLPAGSILWRVRGYNTDGVAGPWSTPAAIVVRAAPPAPSIASVSSEARPTVTWQASGQQAYQLLVKDIYDSGAVYGADKFHKVKVWLTDGSVVIGVRVQNSFGMWSPWAEVGINIVNRPGPAIQLSTATRNNGIALRWYSDAPYQQYCIYRNDVEIAVTAATEYVDYLCNGKHRYTLRGVTSEGQYTISNPATEILMPLYAHIALVGTWDWLTLKARRRARPTHGIEFKSDISYVHYSGRKLPVAEISEFEDRTHSFDFTFGRSAPPGSLERLSAMAGRLVAYKDSQGDFATGILEGLSVSKDIASDISFSIVEVDTS